ncbi:MAG: UDP-N-acetylmuramoyl-L-alanyl-D-glutamate--2,6-diaminopimelate ligase [bacterium]|nr:UDP-N-acetylmuramoyl-L-alanyl-D-glutamate--2,6-diaminopimelate ligase [bacterium]
MKLRELVADLPVEEVVGSLDVEVRGVSCHSKEVQKGFLFVCIKGVKYDGHNFLLEARDKGAVAALVENNVPIKGGFSLIRVKDSRKAAAVTAAKFYGYPSTKLKLIGITGTNGKTTTTYLIESILKAHGEKVGRLSTIGYSIGDQEIKPTHTTPEAISLQAYMARMVEEGISSLVMEVSSHAISLSRVFGCDFDVAVFTNLSQDHLDFHLTASSYLEAKSQLFINLTPDKCAVVNIDDPSGRKLVSDISSRVITYGMSEDADISASEIIPNWEGLSFTVLKERIEMKLLGRHNIYNGLAAIATGVALGVDMEDIKSGIAALDQVKGRFERMEDSRPFNVIIDYAHTPDALRSVLLSARDLGPARIITLFGCGGDRDRGKRPLMGKVAQELSDYVIVTSDNPRSEDPLEIIRQIEGGFNKPNNCRVVLDRGEAICQALREAGSGDLVLIAGKGHEDYQIIGEKINHFDDREVVRQFLKGSNGTHIYN